MTSRISNKSGRTAARTVSYRSGNSGTQAPKQSMESRMFGNQKQHSTGKMGPKWTSDCKNCR